MNEMLGHNCPPIDERAKRLAESADKWVAADVDTDERAAKCRDFIAQLNNEAKRLESARKAEKQPFIDGGKDVDAKYRAPITLLQTAKGMVEPRLRAWLIKVDNERRAEAAKVEAKARVAATFAAAKVKEAVEARTLASAVDADLAVDAAKAAAKAVSAASAPAQVRGAVTGKASSLRTYKSGVIDHLGDAIDHYRYHPELAAVMTRLANAELRHGAKSVPGFRVYTTQTAV